MAIEEKTPEAGGLLGQTIDGFQIVSELGRSVDGVTTFRVVGDGESEQATLRMAPGAGDFAARFVREARLLREVHHPSLPIVKAIGASAEMAYVVTDEMQARDLTSVVRDGLPPSHGLRMLGEAAEALDLAHGAGLLHRAVRPGSLVVGEWLVVRLRLVGFALGRVRRGTNVLEDEQAPYQAPEELRGEVVGPPADHYALASTLFEFAVGVPPFGRSREAALDGHLNESPPPPSRAVPGLPPALDAVFERALAKDPEARYGSARRLVAEVTRALAGQLEPGHSKAQRVRAPGSGIEPVEPEPEPEPEPELEEGDFAPRFEEEEHARAFEVEELDPAPEVKPRSPPRTGADPGRGRIPAGGAAAVLVVAGVLGFLLGQAGEDAGERPAVSTVTSGSVSIRVPEGWRQERATHSIGGLRLEQPLSLANRPSGELLAGLVPGQLAAFDPRTLAEGIDGSPPAAKVVKLGPLQALLWRGLRGSTSPRMVTLFAVPTDRGAVAVACQGAGAARPCGEAAASLRLRGLTAYSPVRAAEWRGRVRAAIQTLRGRRQTELTRLSQASTSSEDGRAARALAAAHGTAVREITRDPVPPQAATAHRAIVAALYGLQRSFEALGRAAAKGDGVAYTSAGQAVQRQENRLREALKTI